MKKLFRAKTISKVIGLLMIILSVSMIPSLITAKYYGETNEFRGFLISFLVSLILGSMIFLSIKINHVKFRLRDGFLLLALCWFISSLIGSLPYLLSGFSSSLIDAIFESTAGFTTTGCTVSALNIVPNSIIVWRAISNWIGGMGILIFILTIIPSINIHSSVLSTIDAVDPNSRKLTSKASDTAKILYMMYLSFTVIAFIFLFIPGNLNFIQAFSNSLASISTGGLFGYQDIFLTQELDYEKFIITIFTILGSMNFVIYYYMLKRKWEYIKKNPEFKGHMIFIFLTSLIIAIAILYAAIYPNIPEALTASITQTISFATTSGFVFEQYNIWPTFVKIILIGLIIAGGSMTSTSGSLKVIRVLVMTKLIKRGFTKRIHPRSVVPIKLNEIAIEAPLVSAITSFIFLYFFTFLAGSLIISLDGLDITTNLTTMLAMLSNSGFSFSELTQNNNYGVFSEGIKLFLAFVMILGRLEIFTVLLIFTPSFWGRNK